MDKKVLPAEWSKQSFIQLAWPNEGTDWKDILTGVQECYYYIINEIALRQKVLLICHSMDEVKEILSGVNLSNVIFAELPYNDTWARDHGGITIFENGIPHIYDFCFNGWGMKFAANHDNQITKELFKQKVFNPNVRRIPMKHLVFEGGGIESDGEGILLTTENCLLSKNRNEYLSKPEIEAELKKIFGCHTVHWLKHGHLIGDDTDGHIDTLARFITPDTIAYVSCKYKNDEQYEDLKLMEAELQRLKDKSGKSYKLIPLPMVRPLFSDNGDRLPATYANFLIINQAVLVPTYNCDTDKEALATLAKCFPDREVIGIDCTVLLEQHGSLHCITMQYPDGCV